MMRAIVLVITTYKLHCSHIVYLSRKKSWNIQHTGIYTVFLFIIQQLFIVLIGSGHSVLARQSDCLYAGR